MSAPARRIGMHRERRRVHYSGRVQGVGFRYTCQALARDHDVAGYVRNLPDGRVELVAEGHRQEIDRFLSAILEEMDPYIESVEIASDPLEGSPFSRFTIRH
jgi:acylphosphatase